MIEEIKTDVYSAQKKIALTFDDGPSPIYTPKILRILKQFKAKATFFLVGKNVKNFPSIVNQIQEDGHDIGNHTYTHPVSPLFNRRKNKEFIKKEIEQTNFIIKSIIGNKPLLFRPTLAKWDYMFNHVLHQAKQFGHLPVGWSWSAIDWLGKSFIIKHQLLGLPFNGGSILLLHDGAEKTLSRSRQSTVKMLPYIIDKCRKKSLEISSLVEMLGINNRNTSQAIFKKE